ncbi:HlyD family type I secretion periplasmic adaptor subunit [Desulforegula conservatrix]|uniref:HlyD family type I secretion periplasmic adaptor subunit n=1 Tax=Desulforegula conservatrix TaxID=153026 RepID=UPI0004112CD8|nr:HlyD family type I secretion periplasmic adaptor subunit [Desulforegula conservatrix]
MDFKKLGFFKKNDDTHEFQPILAEIENSPLNPMGRSVFYILVAIIIFSCLWLFFGKIDIVVTARGKVVPDGEIKIVQPLDTGVISVINFKTGDFVKKGDPLVEIDPSTTEPVVESVKKNLSLFKIEVERIEALLSSKPFNPDVEAYGADLVKVQTDYFNASRASHNKQVEALKQEIEKIMQRSQSMAAEHDKAVSLYAISSKRLADIESVKDIVASSTLEDARKEAVSSEKNLESIKHQMSELDHEKEKQLKEIGHIKESFRDVLLKELSEKKRQVADLEAEIGRVSFMNKKKVIVSPVNGHVNELFVNTVGGVVTPAQKLLSIVPAETPLVIEALVQNRDIGFIESGMDVLIKIDTFDFQKYGMLKGKVKKISHDSINDEKLGPVYKIQVEPLEKTLMVEGKETAMSSGMTVSAEIKVGKRRIIEFFVYPLIKYLHEGMSVR